MVYNCWGAVGPHGEGEKKRRHTNAVIILSTEMPGNGLRAWILGKGKQMTQKSNNTPSLNFRPNKNKRIISSFVERVTKKAKPVAFWKKTHPLGIYLHKSSVKYSFFVLVTYVQHMTTSERIVIRPRNTNLKTNKSEAGLREAEWIKKSEFVIWKHAWDIGWSSFSSALSAPMPTRSNNYMTPFRAFEEWVRGTSFQRIIFFHLLGHISSQCS